LDLERNEKNYTFRTYVLFVIPAVGPESFCTVYTLTFRTDNDIYRVVTFDRDNSEQKIFSLSNVRGSKKKSLHSEIGSACSVAILLLRFCILRARKKKSLLDFQ
jgi:hypothetical protein